MRTGLKVAIPTAITGHGSHLARPNYVCTVCSQTFTRRWRGSVHDKKFHGGVGGVVRLIDYIVGRACGQFLPSDPSLFGRKNRWEKSANVARENSHSGRDLKDSALKLAEIKKLASKCYPPDDVQRILMTTEALCQIKGSNLPLDRAIEGLRKVVPFQGALDYLKL